ncbi:MAG: sigma-70 family RNA polymerase sigma factor [Myxococcota bacterium]|jgi:RNA polymerase sigma-70 factor (ECF subfamily)|nr:sigma-70 family RNA polymerase sigma factor [Myxococcota bacterium]
MSAIANDAALSRRCRQGDAQAWRDFVKRFTPQVYRLALRMLRDGAEAEDASQEAFLRCHRSISSFDPTRPLGPWVSRITYNVCLRRLEKVARMPEADEELAEWADAGPSPEQDTAMSEQHRLLARAMSELSAQDRALLELRYREGFSDAELAESTSMAVGTVKTRLHRARASIRQWFFRNTRESS